MVRLAVSTVPESEKNDFAPATVRGLVLADIGAAQAEAGQLSGAKTTLLEVLALLREAEPAAKELPLDEVVGILSRLSEGDGKDRLR